jgi:hypothetical protein
MFNSGQWGENFGSVFNPATQAQLHLQIKSDRPDSFRFFYSKKTELWAIAVLLKPKNYQTCFAKKMQIISFYRFFA